MTETTSRPSSADDGAVPLAFGHCTFDPSGPTLWVHGASVEIGTKHARFLDLLLRHAGEVLEKDQLLDALWPDQEVSEWSLTRLVSDTRKLLQDRGRQPIIRNVRSRGYKLAVCVRPAQSSIDGSQATAETATPSPTRPDDAPPAPDGNATLPVPRARLHEQLRWHSLVLRGTLAANVIAILSFVIGSSGGEPPQVTASTYDLMQRMNRQLIASRTAFLAQGRRRNQLGETLLARFPDAERLSWEQRFFKHYDDLTEEERFIFIQIRAITEEGLYPANRTMFELLDQNPQLAALVPTFDTLYAHLALWLAKFNRVFLQRPDMCLVYIGVEEGVPFPKQIDREVATWLAENAALADHE